MRKTNEEEERRTFGAQSAGVSSSYKAAFAAESAAGGADNISGDEDELTVTADISRVFVNVKAGFTSAEGPGVEGPGEDAAEVSGERYGEGVAVVEAKVG